MKFGHSTDTIVRGIVTAFDQTWLEGQRPTIIDGMTVTNHVGSGWWNYLLSITQARPYPLLMKELRTRGWLLLSAERDELRAEKVQTW